MTEDSCLSFGDPNVPSMSLVVGHVDDQKDECACPEKLKRTLERLSADGRVPHLEQGAAEDCEQAQPHHNSGTAAKKGECLCCVKRGGR